MSKPIVNGQSPAPLGDELPGRESVSTQARTPDIRREGSSVRSPSQDRPPNFRDKEGRLFLVRHFGCQSQPKVESVENWGPAVASGQCAWCGWKEAK